MKNLRDITDEMRKQIEELIKVERQWIACDILTLAAMEEYGTVEAYCYHIQKVGKPDLVARDKNRQAYFRRFDEAPPKP